MSARSGRKYQKWVGDGCVMREKKSLIIPANEMGMLGDHTVVNGRLCKTAHFDGSHPRLSSLDSGFFLPTLLFISSIHGHNCGFVLSGIWARQVGEEDYPKAMRRRLRLMKMIKTNRLLNRRPHRQCATSHVETHRNRADNSRCSSVGSSGSGRYLIDGSCQRENISKRRHNREYVAMGLLPFYNVVSSRSCRGRLILTCRCHSQS